MKSVVITGSTRGIGAGLARGFLARGCQVTLNGRSDEAVQRAVRSLTEEVGAGRVAGCAGDVTRAQDHQALWDVAVAAFGKVDIWVNNAGIGHPLLDVWEIDAELAGRIVDVDLKGTIYGSQVAVRGMRAQGFGHLYNMEGFGSDGRMRAGLSLYGSTKRGVRFLTRSLALECKDGPVKVSALSPGMVITDFITRQYDDDPEGLEQAKRIFNILGDRVETVTPWLVDKVLANHTNGARFAWLTSAGASWRFLTAPFRKRDLFD